MKTHGSLRCSPAMATGIEKSHWTIADLVKMQADSIKELQEAIRAMHGCESGHVESVPVHEVFQGETAWQGNVEVFDLMCHQKAKRVYACQYQDGNETKSVVVLEIPPVDSPESAVKVAIARKAKQT